MKNQSLSKTINEFSGKNFSDLKTKLADIVVDQISPISNEEKQKLLEPIGLNEKPNTLLNIIKFYSYENSGDSATIQ